MQIAREKHILTGLFLVAVASMSFVAAQPAAAQTRHELEQARQAMVEEFIVGGGITNERVIESMRETPRHEFMPLAVRDKAYFDMGVAIGEGQTISSPFIVAYMTEALDPQPGDRVLEIGTGSGYQAAVLSPLVEEVYTIEIVDALGHRARRTLDRLNYNNIEVKIGDGFQGWAEHAPFDSIVVTCSPEDVPQPLIDQLAEGGRLVIPVGERFQQTLYLFEKVDGELVAQPLQPTLFVPMTGRAEENRQVQPDGANPEIVNADFEEDQEDEDHIPGWYYERQVVLEEVDDAPHGDRIVTFSNNVEGLDSHLFQGFALDGREVAELDLSAWVKLEGVVAGEHREMQPMVAISYYDENRRDLGFVWLGPWRGTRDWAQIQRRVRVPATTREAILRIGLFGATGEASFDQIEITPIRP